MSEDQAILDEIAEELKHDQFVKFVKKHYTPIFVSVVCTVACIVMYTSWKNRLIQKLENTTQGIVSAINTDPSKCSVILGSMMENAPHKVLPIIDILRTGMKLSDKASSNDKKTIKNQLLALSNKNGLDTIWKDLAIIIYASNFMEENYRDVIQKLTPLTDHGRPFRLMAMELVGVIYMNNGESRNAIETFDMLKNEKDISDNMKNRCELFKRRILR